MKRALTDKALTQVASKRQKTCPISFTLKKAKVKQECVTCQICTLSSGDLDKRGPAGPAMIYVCDMSHVNCSDCSIKVLLNQICPCAIFESSAADNIWRRGYDPDIWFETLWKLGTSPEIMKLDTTGLLKSSKSWLKKIAQEKKFGADLFPADFKIISSEVIDLSGDDEFSVLDESGFGDVILGESKILNESKILGEYRELGKKIIGKQMCGSCFNTKDTNRETISQWCAGIKPVDPLLWENSRSRFLNIRSGVSIPCVFGGKHSIFLGVGLKDMCNLTFDYVLSAILDHALNHTASNYCDVTRYCNYCDYKLGIPPEECQFKGHFELVQHIFKEHCKDGNQTCFGCL